MSKVIEKVKVEFTGVEVINNKGNINFRPFNVRRDGQGTTELYDFSAACLLRDLLDEAIKKQIKNEYKRM